jgi:hypothetical protein
MCDHGTGGCTVNHEVEALRADLAAARASLSQRTIELATLRGCFEANVVEMHRGDEEMGRLRAMLAECVGDDFDEDGVMAGLFDLGEQFKADVGARSEHALKTAQGVVSRARELLPKGTL